MEIRSNGVGSSGADNIDLTKANREAIRERAPNPPALPKQEPADRLSPRDQKRVARARDQFEQAASVHKRVADARSRFSVHKRVAEARDRFESVQKRVKEARARNGLDASKDQVTLSSNAQELADTTIAPNPTHVDVAVRAQRVSDLKAQYGSGQLDVESLVAESAYRMLGGE